MIKYFCDVCEQEAGCLSLHAYYLPQKADTTFKRKEYCICDSCEKQLWDFIQYKKLATSNNLKTEFYGEGDDK